MIVDTPTPTVMKFSDLDFGTVFLGSGARPDSLPQIYIKCSYDKLIRGLDRAGSAGYIYDVVNDEFLYPSEKLQVFAIFKNAKFSLGE